MKKEVVAFRRPPIEIVHFVVDLLPILTVFVEDLANKIKVSRALSSREEIAGTPAQGVQLSSSGQRRRSRGLRTGTRQCWMPAALFLYSEFSALVEGFQ